MNTNFNFKSQIATSRSQSERLLALGLKAETADMFWWDNGCGSCAVISRPAEKEDGEYGKVIPAWSLHRLIEMIAGGCEEQMIFLPDPYDEIIEEIAGAIMVNCFNKEYYESR